MRGGGGRGGYSIKYRDTNKYWITADLGRSPSKINVTLHTVQKSEQQSY